jgi:hypothetical protein
MEKDVTCRKRKADELSSMNLILQKENGTCSCDTSKTSRKVRTVRFNVKKDDKEDDLFLYKMKRYQMLLRRQQSKRRILMSMTCSNESWLTTPEIKVLHITCASTVKRMESNSLVSTDDTSSLSRYSTSRLLQKAVVRKQLHDTIGAIQSFEAATGTKATDLLSRACRQLTVTSSQTAYLDALKVQVEVLRCIASSTSPSSLVPSL